MTARPLPGLRNVILVGDVREKLRELQDESIHCVVTSPPYWGLRDYGTEGQLGLEPTPDAYVENMVEVFREVRRVMRKDATLWLNLGDSYAGSGKGSGGAGTFSQKQVSNAGSYQVGEANFLGIPPGLKPKDLVGIPWRVAFALQADGWWLRSDIIWSKPNPMPESVTDRPTKAHEYLFLLTKAATYYYDAEAIREPITASSLARISQPTFARQTGGPKDYAITGEGIHSERRVLENFKQSADAGQGRNKRTVWEIPEDEYAQFVAWRAAQVIEKPDVWTINPQPTTIKHFATYPTALVKPCVLAGTSEKGCCADCGAPWERVVEKSESPHDAETASAYANGSAANRLALARQAARSNGGEYAQRTVTTGWRPTCAHEAPVVPCIVLDPFLGSGTTALVAARAGRDYISIELSPTYAAMAEARVAGVKDRLL